MWWCVTGWMFSDVSNESGVLEMLRTARRASERYDTGAESSKPGLWEPQIHKIRKYGTGGTQKDIIPVNLIVRWPTGVGVNRNHFKVTVSRVMTQGSLVQRYRRFGEICMHFILTLKWSLLCGPKIWGNLRFFNVFVTCVLIQLCNINQRNKHYSN